MLSAVISSILSYPALQLALQPVHQWYVQPGPLVLGSTPLNSSTRIADRDRTVSRRSEPSSRTTLIGEQPNPWDLLQPQDVMSRHRGAKHCRRYELLGSISLLSPAYLLSVELPDNGYQLDIKKNKRGISLVTPQKLTPLLQCLPPMLNMFFLIPM